MSQAELPCQNLPPSNRELLNGKSKARHGAGQGLARSSALISRHFSRFYPSRAISLVGDATTIDSGPTVGVGARPVEDEIQTQSVSFSVKRIVDVSGVLILGLLFSPVILVVVFLLALQGGPILYGQERVGRGGRKFNCLKFRTMVVDGHRLLEDHLTLNPTALDEWMRFQKLRSDPRVTRLGALLRRTSLDELPQLWNIARGEMSLVGPRPAIPNQLERYGRRIVACLSVRPGLTGLWQVSGRNHTTFRRRVALDVYYVRSRSMLLDIYILWRTVGVVVCGSGAY